MKKQIKIFGFGGSLRKGSFTKTLLDEAVFLCPPEATLEVFDKMGRFPLFNQDLENNLPEQVEEFKDKLRKADAILIITPEYNYSVPGYLKNAIDWATRPYGDNSFDGKPGIIMSASAGMSGGIKAQYALRQVCVFLNLHLLNKPEIAVPAVHEKIRDGKLVDMHTKEKIAEGLTALCDWTRSITG